MKICLAGEGAQGLTHMQALNAIGGVDVVTLAGGIEAAALSFNNHGPISTTYRFIGEETTLFIERETLTDHQGNTVPLEGSGFELQDREFLDAIREGRPPLTSCKACLPTMQLLHRIQASIDARRRT